MSPTSFGLVIAFLGMLLVVRGTVAAMLVFVLFMSLFNGASAIDLPALGWATIQPPFFALLFLIGRFCIPGQTQFVPLGDAARKHALLVTYCLYSALTAFMLPTLFEGQIKISPMRSIVQKSLFDVFPLHPSSQNITTAFYMMGTLAAALCTTVVARDKAKTKFVVGALALLAWTHVIFGVGGLILTKMHMQGVLDFFRNGSYAQLNQQYLGFIRISGVSPEASTYASYGYVLLVLMTEMWIRGIRPIATGLAALAMFLTLAFSTSATAYFSIIVYGPVLVLRAMIFPGSINLRKSVIVMGGGLFMVIASLAAAVAFPGFARNMVEMVKHMTVDKPDSLSGQQRQFWARQGWEAFKVSYGLGIGVGSFRSSSLATAIIGSTGVIGGGLFLGYLFQVVKPFKSSTYYKTTSMEQGAGAAASWAALIGLIPSLMSSPSPDPGLFFAVLCGLAIGWREPVKDRVKAPRRIVPAGGTSIAPAPA